MMPEWYYIVLFLCAAYAALWPQVLKPRFLKWGWLPVEIKERPYLHDPELTEKVLQELGEQMKRLTEVKRQELEHATAVEYLQKVEEMAGVGGWFWDLLHDKVTLTPNFCRLFNVDCGGRIRSGDLTNLIYPEDKISIGLKINEAVEAKQNYVIRYRRLQADGSLKWITCKGFLLADDDDNIIKIEGIIYYGE